MLILELLRELIKVIEVLVLKQVANNACCFLLLLHFYICLHFFGFLLLTYVSSVVKYSILKDRIYREKSIDINLRLAVSSPLIFACLLLCLFRPGLREPKLVSP